MYRLTSYLNFRCEFCNVNGHTVNNCTNPELNQIEQDLYNEKEQILMDNNILIYNQITHLCDKINSIFGRNIEKLKAYAIIKCKYRSQNIDLSELYEYIGNYVFQNDLPTNIVVSHDYIPFDENDAVQYLMDFDFRPSNKPKVSHSNSMIQWEVVKEMPHVTSNECPICYENFTTRHFAEINCKHVFCIKCIKKLSEPKPIAMCALCRTPIKNIKTLNVK